MARPKAYELDNSDVFQSIEEYHNLTPLQKKILSEHVKDPSLDKAKLAELSDCSVASVWGLFHSKGFERIIEELSKQQLREINLLAVKRIREALDSENKLIRVETAVKLLRNQGSMIDQPKTLKQDNKIIVNWAPPTPEKVIDLVEGESINPILAAQEASGSTPVERPV